VEEGGKHADDRLCGKRTKERAQVSFPSGIDRRQPGEHTETMAFRMEAMPLKTAMMPRPMAETMLASCRGGKESFKSRGGSQPSRVTLWLLPPKSSSR
jgi:hypothetical protein